MSKFGKTISLRNLAAIGSSVSALALGICGSSSAFAQNGETDRPQGIQDIVVTAQKIEQNLQDIPVAVTALNQQALENAQITSLNDLAGQAPNLSMQTGSSSSQPVIVMRGIIGANTANGTDSPIATYVDGIYHSRLVGMGFDTADLERVEILRGPQGTLYGKNSTGGAINFITAGPKGELYLRHEVTVGNYGRLRAKTRVDLPKFGAFSISGTFAHDEIDGFRRNSQAGLQRDYSLATRGKQGLVTSPRSFGANNSESGTISVRYEPDSLPLKVDYKYMTSRNESTPNSSQSLGFPNTPAGAFGGAIVAFQPAVGGVDVVSLDRLDAIPGGFTSPELLTTWSHALIATLDLPGDVQLKSITGYHGFTDSIVSDLTGNGGLIDPPPVLFGGLAGGTGQPFTLLTSTIWERSRQFSQELQLNHQSDTLDLIGGLYYSRERTESVTPTFIAQPLPTGVVPAGTAAAYNDATARNSSYAVFGQGTFHATEQLDITAGARYTHDKRNTDSRTIINGTPVGDFSESFNNVSWMVNVAYKPNNDTLFYGKVSTGYLSGGIFNGFTFEPEKVIQYEVGSKLDLLDRRLRINAVAYYTDYKDQQIGANNDQSIFVFQNAGKARIYGFEAEITAVPVDGLTLTTNYGYNNFKYKEYIIGGIDVSDDVKPQRLPRHTLLVGADYALPAFSNGAELNFNVSGNWHSKKYLAPNVTTYSDALNRALRDNDWWNVRTRATLRQIPLGSAKGKVSVWAENLLNKRKLQDANDLGLVVAGNYHRGRTYGVDFGIEF